MDHDGIRKSLRIVESAQSEVQCSCRNRSLTEWAGLAGLSQTFNVGGLQVSIGGTGSVTINGRQYSAGQYTGTTTPRPLAPSVPSSAPSAPPKVDTNNVGKTKIVYYGNVSQQSKTVMESIVNEARQHLESKGLGWLMAVTLYIKHDDQYNGTYFPNHDEVWLSPAVAVYTVVHEFGHRFHYRVSRSIFPEIVGKYRWCLQNDSTAFVRSYSRQDEYEFWADAFATWVMRRPINPYIATWVGQMVTKYNP